MVTPSDERESLLEFLYACPVGIIKTGLDGAVQMLNPKAAQLLLPISKTQSNLANLFDALQHHAPEVRNLVSGFAGASGVICENHQIEIRNGTKDKSLVLALTIIRLERNVLMVVLQDVTTVVAQERAIRSREQRLQAIFDGVRDYAIYSLDDAGRIETWNKSAERVEGYTSEEAIGREYGLDYPPEKLSQENVGHILSCAAKDGWHEEEGWRVRRGGGRFWASTMVSVLRDSEAPDSRARGFSVITRDISDRKQLEDALVRMASTDYLTGLYNRRYFFEHAPEAAAACAAGGQSLSVIMIDVDKFKHLNDTQGHDYGDRALQTLASICQRNIHTGDIVARFGGEEFAILLLHRNRDEAAAVAGRIRSTVEATSSGLTVSLGVAQVNGDIDDALRAADRALFQAKDQGRNRVVVA